MCLDSRAVVEMGGDRTYYEKYQWDSKKIMGLKIRRGETQAEHRGVFWQ